jgi:hypothetical protein
MKSSQPDQDRDPHRWLGRRYPNRYQKINPYFIQEAFTAPGRPAYHKPHHPSEWPDETGELERRWNRIAVSKYCQTWKQAIKIVAEIKQRLDCFDGNDTIGVWQTHTGKLLGRWRGSEHGWIEF